MKYLLFFLLLTSYSVKAEDEIYFTNSGTVAFRSEAQQELIRASSQSLRGVLDPQQRTYVFKVLVRTFHGFNSSLQQEHFNEKYLESEKYPEATFSGKIIEDIDLSIDGFYEIRAKGKLNVHGVEMERIIKSNVVVSNGKIQIETHFSILLSDHNIKVPKVVHEKIASEIHVDMTAELTKKE